MKLTIDFESLDDAVYVGTLLCESVRRLHTVLPSPMFARVMGYVMQIDEQVRDAIDTANEEQERRHKLIHERKVSP